jgi:hypothetical protein
VFQPETARLKPPLAWAVGASAQALKDLAAAPVRQRTLNLLLNVPAAAGEGGGKVGFEAEQDGDGLVL